MMAAMTETEAGQGSGLLRTTLRVNSVFSALTGIVMIAFGAPLSDRLGTGTPAILIGLGAATAAYALALWWTASRERIDRRLAVTAVMMDAAWVLGSAVLVAAGPLTAAGNWTAVLVADVVLLFAVLQFLGLRRAPASAQPAVA